MSYEGTAGGGYEVLIEGQPHRWGRGDISVAEIRELGKLPADCKVVAVSLADAQEHPLDEDAVHEVPPLTPGKPTVKRTNFKCGS
ncbi:MAG TPA: hypothetical protein VGR11_07865 [Solirubrobacteraceae bacterium]|nr:hypothetical protein [Solirubrobacteraceae bacterium]